MFIYYVFVFIVLSFVLFDFIKISKETKAVVYCLLLFISVVFYGGRYGCDNDFWNYVAMYEQVPRLGEATLLETFVSYSLMEVEYGFLFCCTLLKTLNFPVQSIFILCALITFVCVGKFFWEISKYPFFGFFLYNLQFFGLPFMQIRFGVAMAIVLYAYIFWLQQKKKQFYLLLFLGLSFHITALAGIIPVVIDKIRLTPKRIIFFIFFAFILMFLPLKMIIEPMINYMGVGKYSNYLMESENKLSTFVFLLMAILPYLYCREYISSKYQYYHFTLLLALSGFALVPFCNAMPILARFYMIMSVCYCIILPLYLLILKRTEFNYLALLMVIVIWEFSKFVANLVSMTDYQFFI